MKKLVLLPVIIFFCSFQKNIDAQDDWRIVKTADGVVQALLPGKAKKTVDKRRTLAGTITTYIMEFRTDDVEFSVSSTKLSRLARSFADDDRIYNDAKTGVLNKVLGKEVSFKKITIDGVDARKLRYEVVDFEDESHKGYHGVAVFLVRKDKVYSANGLMAKDAGEADLKKFSESIKIQK